MSAQLEDGYTRIANELLEKLMKQRLNGTQHNIIQCVMRNTYGFQRKSHAMSLSFISEGTDIHKDTIKRELNKLIDYKIIRVFKEATFRGSREIGINTSTDDWLVPSGLKSPEGANSPPVDGMKLSSPQGADSPPPTGDQLAPQERKSFKENTTTTTEIETVADAYTKVFGTFVIPSLTSEYFGSLRRGGYTDSFIIELLLEAGESGTKPSLRFVQSIAERWIKDKVYSRSQAKEQKSTGGSSTVGKTGKAARYESGIDKEARIAREAAKRRDEAPEIEYLPIWERGGIN